MGESGGGGAAGNWCLIESDPGVFTELIQKFGKYGLVRGSLFCSKLLSMHGLMFDSFTWSLQTLGACMSVDALASNISGFDDPTTVSS